MLNEILTVSGRPGLYKLVARGHNCIIVESVDSIKRRSPVQGNDKAVSLGNISIYTDDGEVSLREVFRKIEEKYGRKELEVKPSKMSDSELRTLFSTVIPEYDRDRVHASHIRKIVNWYNVLVVNGLNDFEEEKAEDTDNSESSTSEVKE